LIGEFDSLVRQRLSCILKYEGSIIEASEVVFSLDQVAKLFHLITRQSSPLSDHGLITRLFCPAIKYDIFVIYDLNTGQI
jgi:hypothetical protein